LLAGLTPYGDERNWCSGGHIYQLGLLDVVEQVGVRLQDVFNELRPRKVVTMMAAEHAMLGKILPQRFNISFDFEVVPLEHYLLDRLRSGQLKLDSPVNKCVAIHDNCFSKATGDTIWSPVRELSQACGVEIAEMQHNKGDALCCGFGAAAGRFDLFDLVAQGKKRLAEAEATGAEYIIVYCSACYFIFSVVRELTGSKLEIYHILELLDMAHVTKVIVENKKATGVEFSRHGKKYIVNADTIVVAAGGIGSPILLENSGIPRAGANFFYDPLIAVFGTVKGLNDGKEFPMAMGQHMVDDGYLMTDMTLPALIYGIFTSEVFRFDRLAAQKNQLTVMIKAKDGLGGKISRAGWIDKPFTAKERGKLLHGYERAKKILTNAGAKDIFKTWYIASHPGGTCKINDIVDSNLKTEFENLYVCDCSVIPDEWGRPPVYSILCLGKRLGKHLAGVKAGTAAAVPPPKMSLRGE
jgi:choline dehydrogenase-like flavoprotein